MPITYHEKAPDPSDYMVLFETTGWNTMYRATVEDLERSISNSWYRIAAYDGDRLVGFGRVVSDGVLYAMIYDLIVDPSFQGRGIGSTILQGLMDQCRRAGIREIQLFSAQGKSDFYKKRGFEERPVDGPGMRFKKLEA
jgi:GNAT superfamily N-acetyltransferase